MEQWPVRVERSLQNSGAAAGERQADGQHGVDQHLGVEVDVTEAQQRDVDQIGQRPQAR